MSKVIKFDELTEIINLLDKHVADEDLIEDVVNLRKESRFHSSSDYNYEVILLLNKYWKDDHDKLYGKDSAYTALFDYLNPNKVEKKLEVE